MIYSRGGRDEERAKRCLHSMPPRSVPANRTCVRAVTIFALMAPFWVAFTSCADISKPDDKGTALVMAAGKGQLEKAEKLLSQGVDANSSDRFGVSALVAASIKGHAEMVRLLLDKGADGNQRLVTGYLPVMIAAQLGHTDVVQALGGKTEFRNDPHDKLWDSFLQALWMRHFSTIETLLENGFDINVQNHGGATALITASSAGRDDVVSFLLVHGADPSRVDASGNTSLIYAAHENLPQTVALLLSHGADMNARNKGGHTPLILASWQGNKEVVKQLLIGGADVLAVAKNGETALSAAVGKGFTEIEDMLRDYGARLPDESRIRFNSGPRGH